MLILQKLTLITKKVHKNLRIWRKMYHQPIFLSLCSWPFCFKEASCRCDTHTHTHYRSWRCTKRQRLTIIVLASLSFQHLHCTHILLQLDLQDFIFPTKTEEQHYILDKCNNGRGVILTLSYFRFMASEKSSASK